MKNSNLKIAYFFAAFFTATLLLTACGGKHSESHDHDAMKNDSTTVYACPMHPEVTGKEVDTCSKCGMKLEAVKGVDTTKMHEH